MQNVDGSFGNCIHGVSRQSDSMMFKGQAKEQINSRNNLTRGMEKRAGFVFIGNLIPDTANGGALDNAKWFIRDNGKNDRYLVALDETRPAIFNLDSPIGDIQANPFSFTDYGPINTQTYYQQNITNPETELGHSNVLDTTFITNRTVVPTGDDANDSITEPPHVVWLEFKTFNPGTEIEIEWNSGASTYTTQVFSGFIRINVDSSGNQIPDATSSARTKEYSGSYQASKLALVGGATAYNNFVRFSGANAEGVKIKQGGEYINLYDNRDIEAIEKLPIFGEEGDLAVVQEGKGSDRNVTYFESFRKGDGSDFGEITWKETVSFGSSGVLNKETMPHVLKSDTLGNFTFEQYDWRDRKTGDKDSNPYPSFILNKNPIQDIGLFQNKLYMSAGEILAFSATDTYTDLWYESAAYKTDADPFEVFATTDEFNELKFSSQFDGDLIIFSDNGQFSMSGEVTQTYNDATLTSIGHYKADLLSEPVSVGSNIFFATNYGNFAGVRQFYTDSFAGVKNAESLTDHVNDYIKGRVRHIASSSNLDVLAILNNEESGTMYLYEWRYVGQEKQQSAWSKWELSMIDESESNEFVWIGFLDSDFYAVIKHTVDGVVSYQLWSMDWDDPPGTYGLPYSVRLDAVFNVDGSTNVYDPVEMRTQITTPYESNCLFFIEGANSLDAGFPVSVYKESGNWYVDGDYTNIDMIGGLQYKELRVFPRPVVLDNDNMPRQVDKLIISKMFLEFSDVGDVTIHVGKVGEGILKSNEFNNRRVNRYNNLPSYIPYEGDTWEVPIRRRAKELEITLESWSYIPNVLVTAEWTGTYTPKRKRI